MKILLIIFAIVSVARAEQPDTIKLSRYGEPTWPNTKKTFQHVRSGNHVDDTSRYVWNTFGKVAETEDGATIYGYQLIWNRATATFYFTISDTALAYYANVQDTEDSDAVVQLQAPLTQNNAWQFRLTDTVRARIVAADTTIIVPAGTYAHCIATIVTEGDDTITRWYAPDVGVIKMKTVGSEFSKLLDLLSIHR